MTTDDAEPADRLVTEYLRRLHAVAGRLPADQRDELVDEITAHIAEARAAGPPGGGDAATHVRNVLERLGEPQDIVDAAHPAADFGPGGLGTAGQDSARQDSGGLDSGEQDSGEQDSVAATSGSARYAAAGSGLGARAPGLGAGQARGPHDRDTAARTGGRIGVLEIFAVILLLIGGFFAGIGWIVGVVLLWASPRWRTADKVLGTLIWPGGLALPALLLVVFGALAVGTEGACAGPVSQVTAVAPARQVTAGGAGRVSISGGNIDVSGPGGHVSIGSGAHPVAGHAAAVASCDVNSSGGPGWLLLTFLIALGLLSVGGSVLVAILLLRRAGRAPVAAAPL